ncbi:putative alpha amylase, catalytic domain subfamily [Chaetomium tenue]|uniref:Alpha amylase, catalytic domain subfamily n=1 Tax=Chaetomium tenue TaxID=1854479 RepID=A0ACB7P5I9_9PEZI|nr:putative alpha amylase, catalytic domain subfamily [Chaetomium globosum]
MGKELDDFRRYLAPPPSRFLTSSSSQPQNPTVAEAEPTRFASRTKSFSVDIFNQRHESFVLWLPRPEAFTPQPPVLVIGMTGGPPPETFNEIGRFPLFHSTDKVGLWVLDPASISPPLEDGVYRYWFEILDTSPENRGMLLVTDPFAFTVDYGVATSVGGVGRDQPASVIKFRNGKLWACDMDGTEPQPPPLPDQATLPSNNHLVIYGLPTSWAKDRDDSHGHGVEVGTFTDVLALFDTATSGSRFASMAAIRDGAILAELGINALELLPADGTKIRDELGGYSTAHYFATDYDMGPASDLSRLVATIHSQGVRLFTDVAMASGHDSYRYIDFANFHLLPTTERDNPDSYQSNTNEQLRDGHGGDLWRYIRSAHSYDPEAGDGNSLVVHPARAFHRCHLARWMDDFGVDGLRLDSVNNIGNYDFVRSYKERAWELYKARYGGSADASKFLVIGEELSMPVSIVQQGIVDALWNEPWQGRLRAVILGESGGGDNFEWTVRKLVNCKLDKLDGTHFTDGTQAVNYITSHDMAGYRKERLYDFLVSNGIRDIGRRAKLAFGLLLTSVGIPMIFAGEEFADQMDRSIDIDKKQTDPVNYSRKNDGSWREDLFAYTANLVKFRTKCPALGEDDTNFFHVDERRGAKIMAWSRGCTGDGRRPVVVVANFSDETTPGSEYVVPNWPDRDKGGWREISQRRDVPAEWVGREPLLAWEAKVYTRYTECV